MKAQDEPGYPLARKRRAHFPKTILETSHQWSPDRPAELHPHEVEPDSAAVVPVEVAQPIQHRGPARFRAVEPDRHLRALIISPHGSSMYHKWYIVQRPVLCCGNAFAIFRRPAEPMAMIGMHGILPMHTLTFHRGHVTLRIGEPISTDGMTTHQRAELTALVRQKIVEMLG